ncbi:rod-determining factor RdfA [Halostagnicola kamekurae]|uniref:Uncharacterized protein n=1 Tax=Halostagnicola kamekurae TaxID=619731 RepID=A0A1I6UF71_9EURY|nr:rod-determining factor RdfA [Halostagnicola kamekurae]SFT00119.1 hypothetical protein SAMN04488556_3818 [Halostagnicola kamekurae]
MTGESDSRRRTKVERVIDTYDLDEWGARLEAEWLGDGGNRTSLRDLATEFNIAILQKALREAGGTPTRRDVENTYEILTDQEGSSAERIRKRRGLERTGVDIDEVRSDFVTHQAIHTYLTTVREAELPKDDDDESRRDRKKETIQRLASRTQVVTDSTVGELVRAGLLTDRQYDVLVSVTVVCEECGTTYTVDELIDTGGCECTP